MMLLTKLSSINAHESYKQFWEREGSTFKLICVHNAFPQLLVLPVTVFENFKVILVFFIELKSVNLRHVNIM